MLARQKYLTGPIVPKGVKKISFATCDHDDGRCFSKTAAGLKLKRHSNKPTIIIIGARLSQLALAGSFSLLLDRKYKSRLHRSPLVGRDGEKPSNPRAPSQARPARSSSPPRHRQPRYVAPNQIYNLAKACDWSTFDDLPNGYYSKCNKLIHI